MNPVRKLHRILDEEHGKVIADEIEVALIGVELDRETPHVPRRIRRAALARDRGESDKDRRALAGLGEKRRARELRERFVAFEVAMRAGASSVHDALGNALMIEVNDLLAEDEVFEKRRPPQPGLERVLVVGDGNALVRGECAAAGINPNTVERPDRGIEAHLGVAAPEVLGGVHLRERAAADRRVRRLDR